MESTKLQNGMRRIFVIDDDPGIRMLLEAFLGLSFQVDLFQDQEVALEMMERGEVPDLVITDLYNSNSSRGLDLVGRMRESNFFRFIPVIILSGANDQEQKVRCLELGANDYISKPFNPIELQLKVRNLLLLSTKQSVA